MTAAAWWRFWERPWHADATTIMGLRRMQVYTLAATLICAAAALGLAAGGVARPWLYLIAFVLNAVAVVVLLEAGGDPVEGRATAVIVGLPVLSVVCALAATARDAQLAEDTVSGVIVTIFAFVCVRGRVAAAWGGLLLTVLISLICLRWRGPDDGFLGILLPNVAVLVMATLFAMIVRPRARQIYALQLRAEQRSAAAAGARAARAVRDQQMAYLDQRVRPMLELIASGAEIDDGLVDEAQLLEAALRDRIRAPGLDRADLAAAAWGARARGAKVVLLDDRTGRADDDVEPVRLAAVCEVAGAVLADVDHDCVVTIRLLPERRERLATVTVVRAGEMRRWAFDAAGNRVEGPGTADF
ncbi:hypothetical protein [Gordonia sp. FQ]|uniref:hypothetical protein n=1 Tax=Gordonia sp. FQ TaxID=3446634 RepID=UPI003F85B3D8